MRNYVEILIVRKMNSLATCYGKEFVFSARPSTIELPLISVIMFEQTNKEPRKTCWVPIPSTIRPIIVCLAQINDTIIERIKSEQPLGFAPEDITVSREPAWVSDVTEYPAELSEMLRGKYAKYVEAFARDMANIVHMVVDYVCSTCIVAKRFPKVAPSAVFKLLAMPRAIWEIAEHAERVSAEHAKTKKSAPRTRAKPAKSVAAPASTSKVSEKIEGADTDTDDEADADAEEAYPDDEDADA
jgi:hypothetical protein